MQASDCDGDVASESSDGQMGLTEYMEGAHRIYANGIPGPWMPNGEHPALGDANGEQALPTQAEILRLTEITRQSMRELNAMAWEVGFLERESNWMPNDDQMREIEVTEYSVAREVMAPGTTVNVVPTPESYLAEPSGKGDSTVMDGKSGPPGPPTAGPAWQGQGGV